MKTCPFCKLENDDTAEACQDCGVEFRVPSKQGASEDRTHLLAYKIGITHFIVSFLVGILAINSAAGRWGDSYHEYPSEGLFTSILIVLEAPVALFHWVLVKCLPQPNWGLFGLGLLIFMGFLWSLVFGWLAALLYKKIK